MGKRVHIYYIKEKDFWTIPVPNGLSWSLRKFLHNRDLLQSAGGGEKFVQSEKFKIQKMYVHLTT